MQIIDVVQGTQEWLDARCGIPSASNFDKIVTSKGEPSKSLKSYLYKLAAEKITGEREGIFQSDAMLRGIELESQAKTTYEFITDSIIVDVGFCVCDGFGASPDGLIGEDGQIEIKCPNSSNHIEYLKENKLPTKYIPQVQGQLLVTGRQWCDFMSFYPAIKPLILRVERDEKFISKLKEQLEEFCQQLERLVDDLR